MIQLEVLAEMNSGIPQFRIAECFEADAPIYMFYSQADIVADLANETWVSPAAKKIVTKDDVSTVKEGDVIFSLISGTATLVRAIHDGYIYTHNYVKLVPKKNIDTKYLIYLLNEDEAIKKQFILGLQGSQVLKYSLKQLKELKVSKLPPIEKQRCIGEIYLKQLQVQNMKKRVTELEMKVCLQRLKEVHKDDRKSI